MVVCSDPRLRTPVHRQERYRSPQKLHEVTLGERREWREMYEVGGVSIKTVAEHSGRGVGTVYRHLKAMGVQIRERGHLIGRHPAALPFADVELTIALYQQPMTARAVGEALGISETTVRRRLTNAGVALRSQTEAQKGRIPRTPVAVEALAVELYVSDAPMGEILERAGIASSTLYKVLRRHGVEPRSPRGRELRRRARAVRAAPIPRSEAEQEPDVPSAPLAAAVQHVMARDAIDDLTACSRAGVPPRTVWAWRTGERPTARLDTADGVLLGLDLLWWEVYNPAVASSLYSPLEWIDVVDSAARAWTGEGCIGV
jgi:transposase